jgi:hypothetical protein
MRRDRRSGRSLLVTGALVAVCAASMTSADAGPTDPSVDPAAPAPATAIEIGG